ncbi:myeloid leukemia factor isoform X2 [Rhodnius prolixus]|uniref:myeloid leukemia factor isoform X2 n=1 Tax=Rhodnius prolixus TaxID=13249 RepID=UPI003D18E899
MSSHKKRSGHVRRMNNLMSSFFRDPFSDMMFGGNGGRSGGMLGIGGPLGGDLLPFTGGRHLQSPVAMMLSGGFPSILDPMGSTGTGSHVSAMSTVMTMTQGPDGRPQVYQASQSVRQGPGGIRETKKTVADSRTGVKKMSIGRHVYDRGHIIEREQNVYSGEREENEEFINMDEEEADDFNKEWESRARQVMPGRNSHAAIGYGSSGSNRRRHQGNPTGQQLALPSTVAHPPQPPQRYAGRSSRRATCGLPNPHHQPSSTASKIAASIEESDGEEEPPRKRKKEIIITEVDDGQEDDEKIVLNDDDDDEEEDEEDEEDEVQEVIDDSDNESNSVHILNNKYKKKM